MCYKKIYLSTAIFLSPIMLLSYQAKLSSKDHYNSRGVPLKKAEDIIAQDRANYHKFKKRDPQDEYDSYFTTLENRLKIKRMLQRGGSLTPALREKIVNGEPIVEITKDGDKLYVKLIDSSNNQSSGVSNSTNDIWKIYPLTFLNSISTLRCMGVDSNGIRVTSDKEFFKFDFKGRKLVNAKFPLKGNDFIFHLEEYPNSYYIASFARGSIFDKEVNLIKKYDFSLKEYRWCRYFYRDNGKDYLAVLRKDKNGKIEKNVDIFEYGENNRSNKVEIKNIYRKLTFSPIAKLKDNSLLIFYVGDNDALEIIKYKNNKVSHLFTIKPSLFKKYFKDIKDLDGKILYQKRGNKIVFAFLKSPFGEANSSLKMGILDLNKKSITFKDYEDQKDQFFFNSFFGIRNLLILPTGDILVYGYIFDVDIKDDRAFIGLFDKNLNYIMAYKYYQEGKKNIPNNFTHIFFYKDKLYVIEKLKDKKDSEYYLRVVLAEDLVNNLYTLRGVKEMYTLINSKSKKEKVDAIRVLERIYYSKNPYMSKSLKASLAYLIGESYFEGLGVKEDYKKSYSLGIRSCDNNHKLGCTLVAKSVIKRDGDINEALEYASKGCSLGDENGCKLKNRIKDYIAKEKERQRRLEEKRRAQEEARRRAAVRRRVRKISIKFHGYTGYNKSPTYDLYVDGKYDGMIYYYRDGKSYVISTVGIKQGKNGINGTFAPSINDLYTAQCGRTRAYSISDAINKSVKCIYDGHY